MLFTVPDFDSPSGGAAAGAQPGGAPSSASKAPSVKVELDIEDAPFLEEPKEEVKKEPPKAAEKPAEAPKADKAAKIKFMDRLKPLLANKKKLAIIGGALVLIIVAAVAGNIFLSKKADPPAPVAAAEPEPQRIVVTGEAPPMPSAPVPKFLYKWEPFLIERRTPEGEIRFLRCRFTIPTDNPTLYGELQAKRIPLRDAVFYYLVNKPLTFLSDSKKTEELKQDLLSVVNEHISSEKVKELYIEEYLVSPI